MKKIMFNDKYGLTQAVLEGRKTQTRRLLKHQPSSEDSEMLFYIFDDERYYDNPEQDPLWGSVSWRNPDGTKTEINKVAYLIGEEVAIAQSYFDTIVLHDGGFSNIGQTSRLLASVGAKNKMFVKAKYMPHRIKITNIRVERLQDISEEDCLKEGIRRKNERYVVENEKGVCFYTNDPKLAFRYLIDKTCGKGTWDSNPYVFVYEFELAK